jgi:CRISPR-associated protein Cas2
MIVLILTDCPPALRGDLTKWLQEVNTNVYVGRVNARVTRSDCGNGCLKMLNLAGRQWCIVPIMSSAWTFRVHNTTLGANRF